MKQFDKKQITVGVVVGLLIFLFMMAYFSDNKHIPPDQKLKIEQGVDIDTKDEIKESHTEIPVFKSIVVSSDKPNVYLGNPEINDVYFRYKLTLKSDDQDVQDRVLYDNEAVVEPGRAFQVNLRELLDPGEYTVVIDISTFDLDTEEACNGATQEAKLIVNQ